MFVYEVEGNKGEYLVTFSATDKDSYLSSIVGASVFHLKNGCIFSINALNKLIDKLNADKKVENEHFEINWDEYRDTLIITRQGEYAIKKITKIKDNSLLLK